VAHPTARAQGPWAVIWVASLTAGLLTSGMQGIVPAIPAIRDHFGLDNFEIGLITGVYLLPGIFSAFAAGKLAQRIGDRKVVVGGLVVFGLAGGLLLVIHDLPTLLAVRFVQGIVFGALLSITVGIIGSVVPSGPEAHRGQSRRIVAMSVAEAVFPVVGGFLLALSWYAPFGMQMLTLPLAVIAWFVLPKARKRKDGTSIGGTAASVWKAPAIVGVQILAAGRFLFKFSVLTYAPILAVDQVGMSAVLLGQLIGVSSALAAVTALLSERLAARLRSSEMIVACMLLIAISLTLIGAAQSIWLMAVGLLIYGAQDGVYGVAHNVLVNELAPAGSRMAYVGLTGTVRNVGKVVSPLAFGAVTLFWPVSGAFFTFAGIGLIGAGVAQSVARRQRSLERVSAGGEEENQNY
jgi:ACDE family multidrug resistance protein